MEDGLNIGNRASGLGPSIKDMDVLLSALKNLEIQSCMTLTDMRLTEFMGLTEKSATTKLFI